MTRSSLAEKLRVLRAQRGLTVVEAAEQMGVDRHTLRRLERGMGEPRYPTLNKIAATYEVPVEDLLTKPALLGKADAPAETGRNEEFGLLADPRVGEWLRERGLVLGTMTDAEFREHVHGLDLAGRDEDGRPVSVMELVRILTDEQAKAKDLLWNQSNYRSLDLLLAVDPDASVAAQKQQRRDQLNELRKKLDRWYRRRAHAVERYADLLARLWDQVWRETAA